MYRIKCKPGYPSRKKWIILIYEFPTLEKARKFCHSCRYVYDIMYIIHPNGDEESCFEGINL